MKKRTLLAALSLWSVLVATQARSLVLQLTDGTQVFYLLGESSNPVMQFVGGEVTVGIDHYAFTGIAKFFISEEDQESAGVEQIVREQTGVSLQDGVLYVAGMSRLRIYRFDGRAVEAPTWQTDGLVAIGLQGLPAGTYIVQTDSGGVKFVKR